MLQSPAPQASLESQAGLSYLLCLEPEPEAPSKKTATKARQDAVVCAAAAEPGLVGRLYE